MKKLFFIFVSSLLFLACNNKKGDDQTKGTDTTVTSGGKPDIEIDEPALTESIKDVFASFASGDMDAMTGKMADNVRYQWSAGDTLVGRQAVKDYWAGRRNAIDSISFTNEIALPIKVNKSPQPEFAPEGKWVLYWVFTHVTYKNGNKLDFWQHSVNHFNDAGKIDFVGVYIDRAPVNEARKGL